MSVELVDAARARFVAQLLPAEAAASLHQGLMDAAVTLLDAPAERAIAQMRWDMLQVLKKEGPRWPTLLQAQWAERSGPPPEASTTTQFGTTQAGMLDLSLVDDETIAYEIAVSRLTLAIQDPSTWEFADLRARTAQLLGAADLDERDLLRPHILARSIVKGWTKLGLSMAYWRDLESPLHKRWAERAHEAYHEANRWLIAQGVLPEIDLRPFIRKSHQAGKPPAPAPAPAAEAGGGPSGRGGGGGGAGSGSGGSSGSAGSAGGAGGHGRAAPSPAAAGNLGRAGLPPGSHVAEGSALGPTAQAAYEAATRPGRLDELPPAPPRPSPPVSGFGGLGSGLGQWLNAQGVGAALQTGGAGAGGSGGGGGSAGVGHSQTGAPVTGRGGGSGGGGGHGTGHGIGGGGGRGNGTGNGTGNGGVGSGNGTGNGGGGTGHGGSGSAGSGGVGGGQGRDARYTGASATRDAPWADETRLVTRQAGGDTGGTQSGSLAQLLERHLPGFKDTGTGRLASARLEAAMQEVQAQLQARSARASRSGGLGTGSGGVTDLSPEVLVQQLRERHAALKAAASNDNERATIELVALMFQSILTEERLPAHIRIWFARLQMPTLRVALAEPDFFSSEQHPARRLIDRMGGSVLGFEGAHSERISAALEAEIKRVVQVIEAFPDTGRRVFQTVLNEFEKFLDTHFSNRSEGARRGVSLAQQIEQRQTLAVQYTIELRKLLDGVPVPEAVRQFLFQIWADVLATVAVRHGNHSEAIHAIRDAASELVWAASAKTAADERLDMVRRTPALMQMLRLGMNDAGVVPQRQREALTTLHEPLAAAFSAEAVSIDANALAQLQLRLATLEDLLPEEGLAPDESWVMDEALYEYEGVEVVAEGGSMATPETLARVGRLQTGEAFLLERGGRQELVRLVWQGMQQQLWLFVAPQGCLLFQKSRLAAYLQAGLLLPALEDTLMTKATRDALRQIKANPQQLLAV